MNEELSCVTFDTARGWIGILASPRGLLRLGLPRPSAREALELLGADAVASPELFRDLVTRLTDYFGGKRVAFPDSLDLSSATGFQRSVLEAARAIPYGETRSYCWVARQIGRPGAERAVGQALARNPLPIIIPCHRVVTSGGRVGGYSGGAGMKQHLLRLEAGAA